MTSNYTPHSLFTDLYQLTMAQAYHQSGQTGHATFSLFFRNFPPNRAYYVFCGLESALEYLENLSFSENDISALNELGIFNSDFLDYLRNMKFSGDVRAMREGEIFFENEPVMEISGPIIECQLAETFLLNRINLESMLATKSARVVDAARGRSVVDFAARRAHGLDAAVSQARSSYIAGFDGTSNVAAAARFGIPVVGTMSHSYISSFGSELRAFAAYAESFPDSCTFLVDTYDTLTGVANSIEVAREMEERGHRLRAIRLDSGDLSDLAHRSRAMLDSAGLGYVQIIASGGLDEFSISELVSAGAPIDGFGVGTKVGASADAPYTDFVYKLVEYDGNLVMKLSDNKVYMPGPKQVFRYKRSEHWRFDRIHIDGESSQYTGEPLLGSAMTNGARAYPARSVNDVRVFHLSRKTGDKSSGYPPDHLRRLEPGQQRYRVEISDGLMKLGQDTMQRLGVSRSV